MNKLLNKEIETLYERYGNGEITLEEREDMIQELKDSQYKMEHTKDIELDPSLTPVEQFSEVKRVLYEKCANKEISTDEREVLIKEYYDEIFPITEASKPKSNNALLKKALFSLGALAAGLAAVAAMNRLTKKLERDKKIKENIANNKDLKEISDEINKLEKELKDVERRLSAEVRRYSAEIEKHEKLADGYERKFAYNSKEDSVVINWNYSPRASEEHRKEKQRYEDKAEPIVKELKNVKEVLGKLYRLKKRLYKLAEQSDIDQEELRQIKSEINSIKAKPVQNPTVE